MANLVIVFEGMSLMVSDASRSEAFFIGTSKISTPHKHEHVVTVGTVDVKLTDALVWVEDSNTRLTGKTTVTGPFVALLDEIAPSEPLASPMTTDRPDTDIRWLDRLDAWFRLPGGSLDTAPTATTGGNLQWTFPAVNGQPPKARQLTQTGILRRPGVIGPLQLVVQSMGSGDIVRHAIPQGPNGDFRLNVQTRFVGTAAVIPTAGTSVQLLEMQLVYACLSSGSGPIPSATWPQAPQQGPPLLVTSDPATGICPLAFKELWG